MIEKALEGNLPRPSKRHSAAGPLAVNWSVSFSPSTQLLTRLRDGKPPLSSQGNKKAYFTPQQLFSANARIAFTGLHLLQHRYGQSTQTVFL